LETKGRNWEAVQTSFVHGDCTYTYSLQLSREALDAESRRPPDEVIDVKLSTMLTGEHCQICGVFAQYQINDFDNTKPLPERGANIASRGKEEVARTAGSTSLPPHPQMDLAVRP